MFVVSYMSFCQFELVINCSGLSSNNIKINWVQNSGVDFDNEKDIFELKGFTPEEVYAIYVHLVYTSISALSVYPFDQTSYIHYRLKINMICVWGSEESNPTVVLCLNEKNLLKGEIYVKYKF